MLEQSAALARIGLINLSWGIWMVLRWLSVIGAVLMIRRGNSTYAWVIQAREVIWNLVWAGSLCVWDNSRRGAGRAVSTWNLTDAWEFLGKFLVWMLHAILHAATLILSIGQCLCVVWLGTRKVCGLILLLFLTPNKSAVGNDTRVVILFGFFVQTLRSVSLGNLCKRLIMIVAFEELLDAGPLELCLMLHHLLRVCILPFTIRVLCIEVIFGLRWDERSAHPFLN